MVKKHTIAEPGDVMILSRIIEPENGSLPVSVARSWLKLDFTNADRVRMHELALKAQAGELTAPEQNDLESYRRVGRFLDMVHAKARHSLKKRTSAA